MTRAGKDQIIVDYLDPSVVRERLHRLAPVPIDFDRSLLDEKDLAAVRLLVCASRYLDEIFLRQAYGRNPEIRDELISDRNPDYALLREYFTINGGPFDRLHSNRPFINLEQVKPLGADFYPEDMSREEFQAWLGAHPEDEAAFTANFTVIRRQGGQLTAVPYNRVYAEQLRPAATLLRQAADLCANPSLKKYLRSRADAFLSNDYFPSDLDWLDLGDHRFDVAIGPYEVYEDNLFGYKAAFESFVTLVDPLESEKMATVARYLDDLERNLPIPDAQKNFSRGKSSPVLVVEEIFSAGDSKAGIQTTAFNLPNDERVREARGSKKVMLKNIALAKFEKCWLPIARAVLFPEEVSSVSFAAYFNHVLLHEVSHGLGPGRIRQEGRDTTVNRELRETYSLIEESKADVLGIWNLQFLIDRGVFPRVLAKQVYVSYLAGIFRSLRFGIHEAHGGGCAIQLNYLLERGDFFFDPQEVRFGVRLDSIREGIRTLARELLLLEAHGDYAGAQKLIQRYCQVNEAMKRALAKVEHVPVDIRPIYAIENEMP